MSQVVTEEDLVNRSNLLEGALASGSFAEFCHTKIEGGDEGLDSTLWSFLKVCYDLTLVVQEGSTFVDLVSLQEECRT